MKDCVPSRNVSICIMSVIQHLCQIVLFEIVTKKFYQLHLFFQFQGRLEPEVIVHNIYIYIYIFFFQLYSFSFFVVVVLFFPIYFYQLEANYFTILQWVLSYIDMNQPWIYMCSPSGSPLPPPSLPDPSGSSQCTRPKHLSHASFKNFFLKKQ